MNRIVLALGLSLIAGSAAAQTTAPLNPPGSAGSSSAATPPSPDKGMASTPGVVHPGNPDPGMSIKPPSAGITPVVPPPGTGGNTPGVIPK